MRSPDPGCHITLEAGVLAALRDAFDDAVRQLTALQRQPSVLSAREFPD